MVEKNRLVIKNARTLDSKKTIDILISDGKITEIGENLNCENTIEAKGRIISPGFVNIHTHLDKADLMNQMQEKDFGKTLEENRELLKKFKENYTIENVKSRAREVALEMVENGCTSIRTQVDVDETGGLTPLKALLELKKELENIVTIQICVFPQQGVVEEKSREQIEKALKEGADLLGGLPLVEKTRKDQEKHIDILFELAKKYDVDLEVQIDESNDPREFMLPTLCEKTILNKWVGRVSATHCISLSAQPEQIASETIKLIKKSGINVIVTPSANMITRFNIPDDIHSNPSNSITLVKELLDAEVNVAIGTDNIRDIFYPLGNSSIIREMHTLAASTRMTREKDPINLMKMTTVNGAKIIGNPNEIKVGENADLILLNAYNPKDILTKTPIIPVVIKKGKIIVENKINKDMEDN